MTRDSYAEFPATLIAPCEVALCTGQDTGHRTGWKFASEGTRYYRTGQNGNQPWSQDTKGQDRTGWIFVYKVTGQDRT